MTVLAKSSSNLTDRIKLQGVNGQSVAFLVAGI
jgi:hypothetical protein